jgi:ribonucleoside-triphosphate reductase
MTQRKCEVEVFSRVTGFFRPVQSWNAGKTEEFKDRQKFKVDPSMVKDADCRTAKTLAS